MDMLEPIKPYMDWIVLAGIGLVAGWLAGLILGGGGLFRNLIVGIIGALVGGTLLKMGILQIPAAVTDVTKTIPYGTEIFVATIGAILVVLIARIVIR